MGNADRRGNLEDRGVRILSRAGGVVVVLKPAGLATQGPPGVASTEACVRDLVHGGRSGGYLGVPHRLDRAVSGAMLFAETPRAARKLSRQFERREVVKRYRALVLSTGPADAGRARVGEDAWEEWRDLVAKRRGVALAEVVCHGCEQGEWESRGLESPRDALTRVRSLGPRYHRAGAHDEVPVIELELQPVTGRMHQIRVQAAARGMPVLGDAAYGCSVAYEDATGADPRSLAIALHATTITYHDPDTGSAVTVECPPPWRLAS